MLQPCEEGINAACVAAYPDYAKQLLAYRLLHILLPADITKNLPRVLRTFTPRPEFPLPPGFDPGLSIIQPPIIPPAIRSTGPLPPAYTGPGTPGPVHPPGAGPSVTHVSVPISSSTSDGYVRYVNGVWSTVHDALTGTGKADTHTRHTDALEANYINPNYFLYRSFFYFDLTSIPAAAAIISATFDIMAYANALSDVSIQEGTQADPLTTADYDAYTDPFFDHITWTLGAGDADQINTFTLNAAGLTYIEGQFGGTAKLCAREYTHDYLDVDPAPGPTFTQCGMYYSNSGIAGNRPTLKIVYET